MKLQADPTSVEMPQDKEMMLSIHDMLKPMMSFKTAQIYVEHSEHGAMELHSRPATLPTLSLGVFLPPTTRPAVSSGDFTGAEPAPATTSGAAARRQGRKTSAEQELLYSVEEPMSGSYGVADSFPKDFGYGADESEMDETSTASDSKPRILLMGMRRSGKSSIQKDGNQGKHRVTKRGPALSYPMFTLVTGIVGRWRAVCVTALQRPNSDAAAIRIVTVVFHKMSPNETLFLESTNKIYKDDISNSSFVNFQIWDFPGQVDFFDPTFDYEMIFRGTGALIYVIDAQDDYMEALSRLHVTVSKAYKANPDMNFEVFIHKVDGLSDDHKIETQRDIHQRANDDLADVGLEKLHLSFYLTSIYDHSIFEAFSKVVQKLIPQLPTLENLLNIFISVSIFYSRFFMEF
ncbi:unnamed protein product [Ranitomeya imitator]|uniref:Ras-related GTP-binding protein n=1 Tax=Ranitomeya imitator TaxID=111125 RepID=A0ABN9LIA5_9NEOB|nr:unnamed protein product [Ranitomeya imitator]